MNYKLEYISRLFQRTSSKRIEHYVITRLWHQLDNDDIKMVPQQYVNKHEDNYALTDVYFPQFKIHVEVNEPAHYFDDIKIEQDKLRNRQIEHKTGHKVYTIDCRESIQNIHKQIDRIINKIKSDYKTQKTKGTFKVWNPDNEHSPTFWKSKNIITKDDEVRLNTIEDICKIFDADPKTTKRGFLRKGGISHPTDKNILLWWPSANPRSGWQNILDDKNGLILETNSDRKKKANHFKEHNKSQIIRYVFFHYKDVLGFQDYKFVGVFDFDRDNSNKNVGIVWKRIGTQITLKPNSFE